MSVVHAYDRVLKGSKKLKKSDAWAATVFECFFHRLQLEKLEKGVETAIAMTDLHAFTSGVDCFACMDYDKYAAIMPPPERLLMMINRLTLMQPDMPVHPPVGPRLAQNHGATHECVGDAQPDLEPKRCYCFLYPLPDWIELKELGIMKLTALFVARYGMYFCWGLMKKVDKKPQFKFMEPTDSNYSVYNRILDEYERVIEPCCDINYRVCTATVLDAFFSRLQSERLEEGAETAMIDLHAFLCGADCFAHVEDDDYSTFMPNSALLSLMSNRLIRFRMLPPGSHLFYPYPYPYDQRLPPGSCLLYPYPSMGMMQPALPMPGMSPHPPLPLPEEPEPKRQKFDESALVPEDQFISQHPVPLGSGSGIEITVQSWENAASFNYKTHSI